MQTTSLQNRTANNIRILAASMVEKAKSGHPGGAMGGADFINILFSEFLVFDPADPQWETRDRFFLDPGHMSPMLYSVLALTGKYTMDDLKQFRQWGSITPGHPEKDVMRGVENTSGPLGQGHTMAIGAAIAERFLATRFGEWMSHKIYAFISDGGVQEEISQGAGRVAGTLGLHNLIMFYDSNNIQLSSSVNVVSAEDTAKKYEAWGWNVIKIDGNDADQIRKALKSAQQETQRPTIIVGATIMGKGALTADGKNYENQCATHGMPLGEAGASFENTIKNLGGDPENPFTIFPETAELYAQRMKELAQIAAQRKTAQAEWEKANPALAQKYKSFFSNEAPTVDYAAIVQKQDQATRAASSTVLATLATTVENMIVASADLSNSDKTDGFLKKTKAFAKGDFSGSFFQAGVSELTMAAIMNGMALHGGVIPACGTFFVFSDYMKPAVRMAGLMELPVIFIWTHDAFRVGEDGPTHQPVEQEAQIRLMEQLKNHNGKNSMLVLRPADADETTVAWKLALENRHSPTGLILSRQNIKNIVTENGYQNALQEARGAYVVRTAKNNPTVVLIANGSEVATLLAAVPLLEEKGIDPQVVSAPSEGLFFQQDAAYRQAVIPSNIPAFGLTAGLPSTLQRLVGANGVVFGLDHFGFSAPFKVLDEKFGFTSQNVVEQVVKLLEK
ncbi:transketolase family protein [Microbacter margulisiae]|uniref:transketolase n=1 Tax=Microbacter margulisiae TaxID=1350067 RepID=A0A7W5H1J1_9PORP|nr:transketolase [Microbacter margulisiae]MBB3186679.1 transketolase [Microbacter margulisiae]